jgi:UDP-glucose 4-epimerase
MGEKTLMPNVPRAALPSVPAERRIPELAGQRVLVTGGAGMIGSHLVARLLAEGVASVVIVDDLSSGHRELVPDTPTVGFVEGDITDPRVLDEAFAARVDMVFHLAALFANQNSVEHPSDDLRVNGMGTLLLLERARAADVKRFVYSSSSCVYATRLTRMTEDCLDFACETPYEITKLLGERYCHYFHSSYRLPVTIVRYFNAYGPHEHPGRYRNVIPNFMALALDGKPLPVHGDGSATRDFTYVEDTAEGTCLAAVREQAIGEVFNLGTGRETTVLDLATRINRITGNQAGIAHVPTRSWDKVQRRSADVSKAKRLLGFRPRWELEDGLAKTWDWLRAARNPEA